jgi:predicted transcriptional regulator
MNTTVKAAMRDLVEKLPEECTWEDVMDRVYVRQKIQAGLDDAAAGNLIDHDEVFAEYASDKDQMDESCPS